MSARLVYDLKPINIVRVVCGVTQIPHAAPAIRISSKVYSLLFAGVLVCLIQKYTTTLPVITKQFNCADYLINVLISFQTEDDYMTTYCKYLQGIDNLPGAKRILSRLALFMYFVSSVIWTMIVLSTIIYCHKISDNSLAGEFVGVAVVTIMWLATASCRLNVVLVFSLLYCRVHLVRSALEAEFEALQNRLSVYNFIQKYQMLVQSLKQIDYPLKLLANMCFIFSTYQLFVHVYSAVSYLKHITPNTLDYIFIAVWCTWPIIYLLIISIALDLIADNVLLIKITLLEKRMLSTNERQRSEVNHMLRLVDKCRLTYKACALGPLSLRMMLRFLSFVLITSMGALQIKAPAPN